MTEAAEIAKGLTEAQRRTILMFKSNATGKLYHCPTFRDRGRMRRSLEQLKLCGPSGIMTKLGLSVRAVLQEKGLRAEVARLRGLFAQLACDTDACAVSRQYARAALESKGG